MNTKGMKFLAVLAVLAMAFAAVAVIAPAEQDDAVSGVDGLTWSSTSYKITWTTATNPDAIIENPTDTTLEPGMIYYFSNGASVTMPAVADDASPILILVEVGTQITAAGNADSTAAIYASYVNVTRTTGTGTVIYTTVNGALGSDWIDGTSILAGQAYEECTYAEYGRSTGWAAGEQTSYSLVATSTGMIYGSTTGGNVNVASTAITLSGESSATWTNAQAAAATWTFDNFTGTINTSGTPTNTITLDGFTGVINIADSESYVATVSTWTAGNVQIITAADDKAVVLGADVPADRTLTIGTGAYVSIATQVTIEGTVTVNGTGALVLGDGAAVAVAKGASVSFAGAGVFTLTNTSNMYVRGTLHAETAALTANDNKVSVTGGTVYLNSTSDTAVDYVTYVSGDVYHKSTLKTSVYEATSLDVEDNETLFEAAIAAGATDITATNLVLTEDHVLPEGAIFTADSVNVADGNLTITSGTITGAIGNGVDTVSVTALRGTMTFSSGSVLVNGVIAGGDIVVADGATVIISGSLNGTLTIHGDGNVEANTYVRFVNFVVNNGGVLELSDAGNIKYFVGTAAPTESEYMYVYGTIVPVDEDDVTVAGTGATITVPKVGSVKAKFIAYATAQISGLVAITGTGDIDLSQAQRTQYVDQDIAADKTYGQSEKVIVIGSLSIGNHSTVTIKGELIVNEGVTLTVENGSTLVVNSDIAKVTVNGKIIVEEGGTLTVTAAKGVDIAGSLVSEGTVTIGPNTTVKSGGIIDIKDDATSTALNGGLTVAAGGTVNLRSNISINGIVNKGTVNIPEATMKADVTINQAASGAKVVVGVLGADGNHAFTITDNGLKFAGTDALTGSNTVSTYANTFTFNSAAANVVGGFTISENVTTFVDGTDTYYSNYMILDGIVACYAVATDEPAELAVSLSGAKFVQVNDEFALGESVTLNTTANIDVNGDLYATAANSQIVGAAGASINAYGTVTILSTKFAGVDPYVNGTMYKITVEGTSYNVYTTFEDAIAAAVLLEKDTVYVYGNNYVDTSMTIPEGMTVKTNTATGTIWIGSIDNTAVVTVEDGAVVKDLTINVDGTLIFENYRNNKQNTIYSDVYVKNGDMQKYTNVYAAIAGASDGDTVTTTADVTVLKNNLTIPAGVTLNVPASKVLKVAPGTTLTVNGVLQTAEPVLVDTSVYEDAVFGTTASLISDPATACIAVNGIFKSMADVEYDYYSIPGAYYAFADSTGAYNYVSPVAVAVNTAASSMEIFGEVTTGDVTWAGTSSSVKTFTINSAAKLVSGTLSFTYVNFDNNGTYTGSLVYSDAKVTASKVSELTVFNTDGADKILYVSSVTIPSKCSFTVDSGFVALGAVTGNMKIASGAIVSVPNTVNTVVNGTLTVNGTFYVENGKQATVTTLNDLGSVVVDPATTTVAEGILTVTTGYIGMTQDNIDKGTAAAASLSGPINATVLYVSGSATLDDDAKASLENKVSVTFIAGKATWFVVYGNNGFTVAAPVFAPVENAILTSWNTKADGSGTATEAGATITVTADKTLYAIVETAIYQVIIITDSGIKSVAIDNIEMIRDGASNIFYSYDEDHGLGVLLEAGTHTVKYTLYNGYEGTAQLYTMDNTVLKDLKFTVSGTDLEDLVNSYQLYGTEQIVTPEPSPVEQNEWTITTILLVILVILIAIMAVIVAIRLNRS
ncbi:hypothetical protein PED39_06190 [Methanomassiliicoccales archaeon LGM-RCC1]|nr:hypothetical protein PED39_06190 [Methanomassiliicoccales archaeon LGM-RCC1]